MSVEAKTKYAKHVELGGSKYTIFDIKKAALDSGFELEKLPYSLRVLFENVVRHGYGVDVMAGFKKWLANKTSTDEINYMPTRVLMQDFTGVPAIVDLASMRDAMKVLGRDLGKINPMIPVDLVIDHSVQVDSFGKQSSFEENVKKEMERNKERYQFLKWGQSSFRNFRVVPPGMGICHQVNLEYLAHCIYIDKKQDANFVYPDTLVGTDSHTTMINALAVLGWGVGGIEAEAAMLGQPLPMILPEVIGVNLTGSIRDNITATDLVLTVTQMLRAKGVVGKFVEFFGSGLDNLSLADRATIANMAPEYGATCGFFPIDNETLKYLTLTGRPRHHVQVVEEYAKMQGMWRDTSAPEYTAVLELDMSTIESSLAGPKRPQDRVLLSDMQSNFKASIDVDITQKYTIGTIPARHPEEAAGRRRDPEPEGQRSSSGQKLDPYVALRAPLDDGAGIADTIGADKKFSIGYGDIVIAAITSCTNTSNPSVMIAAGIVAQKASNLGLKVKPWVKTSLAPGSQVVTEYLNKAGLSQYLDNMGFHLVGYGCTTCIGNSGPLDPMVDLVVRDNDLTVVSILSGNRNFEGRVHPQVKANYLASPPLVVAYAIAGTVNIDLDKDPIGQTATGKDIYLKDIWPTQQEINGYITSYLSPEMFTEKYKAIFDGDENWQNIATPVSDTYDWQSSSTYINNPPYFEDVDKPRKPLSDIKDMRILALFGDSITTDHISPAGTISSTSPAAQFLMSHGVLPVDFNSYGSRRGNHEVMIRGTFANVRIKNQLCHGVEGGFTINCFTGQQMSIYDAAMDYKKRAVPLVIFAGKEYGAGSSRDWAAKGTNLLGVKAVLAESFERIHRSNLVGMGVFPIIFNNGMNWQSLNLRGDEEISILGINDEMKPYQPIKCLIKRSGGNNETIDATLQVYTDNEIEYIKHGSILGAVIKNLSESL